MSERTREILSYVQRLMAPGVQLPTGASEDDFVGFEHRTGISMPPALREWLAHVNGVLVPPGGLYGIRPGVSPVDIEPFYDGFPDWKTMGWIPVAGDGVGDYYVMAKQAHPSPPILFIDPHDDPNKPAYVVASDLWRFLRFLFRKETAGSGWPFDREEVLREDPEIAHQVQYPLPWET